MALVTCVVVVAMPSVYPSGAALATASAPMAPEAPARFSITIGLAELLAELGRHEPPDHVHRRARRQRHDHADLSVRPIALRVCIARGRDEDKREYQALHGGYSPCVFVVVERVWHAAAIRFNATCGRTFVPRRRWLPLPFFTG